MVDWICANRLRRVFVRMLVKEHELALSRAEDYYTTPRANIPSSEMMTSNASDLESDANHDLSVLSTAMMIARRWSRTPSCPPKNLAYLLDEAE